MRRLFPVKYKLKCLICKGDSFKIRFENPKYKILQCSNCGLGFLKPFPNDRYRKNFYEESYFLEKNVHGYSNYLNMKSEFEKEAESRLIEINKYIRPPASLLDLGAGLGLFANFSANFGYKTEILDVSDFAVKYVKKTYKINGFKRSLSEPFDLGKKFKAVTAWDVIEHVYDLNVCFRNVGRVLENGGYLFLTTPNLDSWDARILGKRWYGFVKIPEHIFYLTPKALRLIAEKHDFSVLTIKQGGFYRSLNFLAEKLFTRKQYLGKMLLMLFKILRIDNKILYFPMVDMFVVLKKTKEVK